ncbi:hypothetical protein ACWCRD_22640 [Streptomyces sp. NPDC002092]
MRRCHLHRRDRRLVHDSKRVKVTGNLDAEIGGDDMTVRNLFLDATQVGEGGAAAAHTCKRNGRDAGVCGDGAAPAGVGEWGGGLVESTDGSYLPLQP